ncbi:MAG: rRNA (guanine-N1)-methyltransferase [Oceanospirillaceae bacterium]|nr:rRNA (guanine-N1)-methyltransferase [Oceanospirillaceae bacterium]
MNFACPVCHGPLLVSEDQTCLRCELGHSFDRARQGYWNLLLPQRKRSRDPGDSAEMIQARRRFLDAGYYWLIAEQVGQLLIDRLGQDSSPRILDLACGEGYYTAQIEEALNGAGLTPELIGLDISKPAIRAACKRSLQVDWLVATGADIPVPAGSLDVITLMFSRIMAQPMARALRPGGFLIVVWPGAEHLIELREAIYDQVRKRELSPAEALSPWFEPLHEVKLSFDFEVSSADGLSDLLAMTPHGQRIRAQAREALLERGQLDCHADIRIGIFQRSMEPAALPE